MNSDCVLPTHGLDIQARESHPTRDSADLNVLDVGKIDVVVLIPEEFALHLQHLDLPYFLKVVANLEALFLSVILVLLVLEQGKLIWHVLVIV